MFRWVIFSCLFLATFVASAHWQRKPQQEIVGGYNTEICEVPYQVSVRYNKSHLCGGSIIGPKHILTAASCVEGKNQTLFSIRAGSKYHNKGGKVLKVGKIFRHSNFSIYSADYNAAVLVLKKWLTLSEKVKIVSLSNTEPKEGEMVLISGWGSMGEGKPSANFLQSVSVPVVSKTVCYETYGYDDSTTNEMFCAGHGGKDACSGDSGGPAVVNGKLVGIVSWGEGCGDESFPSVYTNIAKILSWILAQTQYC